MYAFFYTHRQPHSTESRASFSPHLSAHMILTHSRSDAVLVRVRVCARARLGVCVCVYLLQADILSHSRSDAVLFCACVSECVCAHARACVYVCVVAFRVYDPSLFRTRQIPVLYMSLCARARTRVCACEICVWVCLSCVFARVRARVCLRVRA